MKFVDIHASGSCSSHYVFKVWLYYRAEGVYYLLSYLDTVKDDILHRSYVYRMVLTC